MSIKGRVARLEQQTEPAGETWELIIYIPDPPGRADARLQNLPPGDPRRPIRYIVESRPGAGGK